MLLNYVINVYYMKNITTLKVILLFVLIRIQLHVMIEFPTIFVLTKYSHAQMFPFEWVVVT